MKKAGIFAAVIILILLFMQLYNFKLMAYTDEACYMINSEELLGNLLEGPEDANMVDIKLEEYDAYTPIYERLNKLYMGEDCIEMDLSYPLYVNEGETLLNMTDQIRMINSDFATLSTYQGLYVALGTSFNWDREQADPDEFIFLSLPNGLFMNVQDLYLTSQTKEYCIPSNTIMNLEELMIRYYEQEKGILRYEENKDLLNANVSIGSLTCTYEELLQWLRFASGTLEEQLEEEEETTAQVVLVEGETGEVATTEEETTEEETTTVEETTTEEENSEEETTEEATIEQDKDATSSDATQATTISDDDLLETDSYYMDDWLVDDILDGSGSLGEYLTEGNSGSSSTSSGTGSSGAGSGTGSGELTFIIPTVTLSDFVMSVYSATTDITILDPQNHMYKGVQFIFYEKGEERAYLRKLVSDAGTTVLSTLPPDTYFEVEAYFSYIDEFDNIVESTILEKQLIKTPTLGVDMIEPFDVTQEFDADAISPMQIQITNFQITNATPSNATDNNATDSSTSQYELLASDAATYISSVTMSAGGQTLSLTSSLVSSLKKATNIDWLTKEVFSTNSTYEYTIVLKDRFGNVLNTNPEELKGTAYTSKRAPTARITVDRDSVVGAQIMTVTITNSDNADLTGVYLEMEYSSSSIIIPLDATVGENTYTNKYEIPLNESDTTDVIVSNLIAGTVYKATVRGTYKLNDGKDYTEVLGTTTTTTGDISDLGTVSFTIGTSNITSSSVSTTARVYGYTVAADLFPFLCDLEISLVDASDTSKVYFETTLSKANWNTTNIDPGDTVTILDAGTEVNTLYQPSITLSAASITNPDSVWESIFNYGTLNIEFQEGQLESCTQYQWMFKTYAKQEDLDPAYVTRENVTGRYYTTTFTTLRQSAEIDYEYAFVTGTYANFYGFEIIDPDGAIVDGEVTLYLTRASNGAEILVKSYTVDQLASLDVLKLEGLTSGVDYRLAIKAWEYNEAYSTSTRKTNYVIPYDGADYISFKTEDNLSGSLELANMSSGFVQEDEDVVGAAPNNLIDLNDAVFGEVISSTGDVSTNTGYILSDYIPVEEDIAYIYAGYSNSVGYYDENKEWFAYKNWNGSTTATVQKVLEGTSYIRINIPITSANGTLIAEATNTEADSEANLFDRTTIKENYRYTSNATGGTYSNWFGSELIPVEAGKPYAYVNFAATNTYGYITYLDANQNYVSYRSFYEFNSSTIIIPDGVAYARVSGYMSCVEDTFFGRIADTYYGGDNLCEGVSWTTNAYINGNHSIIESTNDNDCYSDYIELEPSVMYMKDVDAYGIQVLDENKYPIGYIYAHDVRFKMPENGKYVRLRGSFDQDTKVPSLYQVGPATVLDDVDVSFDVTLKDANGNLESCELLIEQEINGDYVSVKTISIRAENGAFEDEIVFDDSEIDASYRVTMQIVTGGYTVVLDTLEFETEGMQYVIKSNAALSAVATTTGNTYTVVADLDFIGTISSYFYGTLDFQGHTLTRTVNDNAIGTIGEGAVVENLVLETNYADIETFSNDRGGLAGYNYGTIRNIVLHLNDTHPVYRSYFGGIVYQNLASGVIENFVVNLKSDFYVHYLNGALVGRNYGTIRNGYVMGNGYKIQTLNQTENYEHNYRGGIVGLHYSGIIENIYTDIDLEAASGSSEYGGMVAGSSTSSIENVIGVGYATIDNNPFATRGPVIGNVSSANTQKNIYYVDTWDNAGATYYTNTTNLQIPMITLWDQEWMTSILNRDDQFDMDMITSGYYPQLIMPDEMSNAQPTPTALPYSTYTPPTLTSVILLSQETYSGEIKINFKNPSSLEIKDINLAKADESSGLYTYTDGAATVTITSQGFASDGETYEVYATVTNPAYYRSMYYVHQFTAGMAGSSVGTTYTEDNRERMGVPLEFYKDITTLTDWRNNFSSNAFDTYGNYRLAAETFDFSSILAINYAGNYRNASAYYGKLTGSFMDANGASQIATLKNLDLTDVSNLFPTVYGSITDLYVDGMSITSTPTSSLTNRGLIGTINQGIVDNVHIKNAEIMSASIAGGLAGQASNGAIITNSSVTDSSLTTYSIVGSSTVNRMGGLLGYADGYSSMTNCFVQNVDIVSEDVTSSQGFGGIIGNMNSATIENCYATGSILSNYPYTGGIVGYINSTEATISSCWNKMDIETLTGYAGGIVGYATNYVRLISNNLSVGDVVTYSESAEETVHRLAGDRVAKTTYTSNGAYANQVLNNSIQLDVLDDMDYLLKAEELKVKATYVDQLGMTEAAYCWSDVSNSHLPRLYNTSNTALLPNQELEPLATTDIDIEVSMWQSSTFASDYETWWKKYYGEAPSTSLTQTDTFVLQFDAIIDGYTIISVESSSLNLRSSIDGNDTYIQEIVTDVDGSKATRRQYPFVATNRGGDRHSIVLTLEDVYGNQVSVTAVVSCVVNHDIYNANDWNKVMGTYGYSYENFKILGNIDPKNLTSDYFIDGEQKLLGDLKVNSLIGGTDESGNYYTISGVSFEVDTSTKALLSEVVSGIDSIKFEDITIIGDPDASYNWRVGIIGTNAGNIKNVEFENIKIDTGYVSYIGCISYNTGNIYDVTLEDVFVSATGSYVGGLVGYSISDVYNITATGTLSGEETTGYDSTYKVSGNAYVGGIVGYGSTSSWTRLDGLYATEIMVEGIARGTSDITPARIAGLVGRGYVGDSSLSEAEATAEDRWSTITDSVVFVDEKLVAEHVAGVSTEGTTRWANVYGTQVLAPSSKYVGGVTGYNASNAVYYANVDVGTKFDQTLVSGDTYVGGIAGYTYGGYYSVDNTEVMGTSLVGGITGYTNYGVYCFSVDRTEVIGTESYVGGAVGHSYEDTRQGTVSRSTVTGGTYVGGISGYATNTTNRFYQVSVMDTDIIASKNSETEESYAGGIVGYSDNLYSNFECFVDEMTTVTATGNYVGGIAGLVNGGEWPRMVSAATVKSKGDYVGGLMGGILGYDAYGYEANGVDYGIARLYQSYFAGNVTGNNYVGGLFGNYEVGDAGGPSIVTADNFYGLLMVGKVTSTTTESENQKVHAIGTFEGSVGATRIYDCVTVNDIYANIEYETMSYWDTVKPEAAGGTAVYASDELALAANQTMLLATADNLQDPRFYFENQSSTSTVIGSMQWTYGEWRTSMMLEHDATASNDKNTGSITVEVDGTAIGYKTMDDGMRLYQVPEGKVPSITIDGHQDGSYYYLRRKLDALYGNGYDFEYTTLYDAITDMELKGAGYYCVYAVATTSGNFDTVLVQVDTQAYLPWFQNTSTYFNGQEGFVAELTDTDKVAFIDNTDFWVEGGIEVPTATPPTVNVAMLYTALAEDLPEMKVYPSGVDTINVEFVSDYDSNSYFVLIADNQTVAEGDASQLVYSVSYDFQTPLTLMVANGMTFETQEIHETEVSRTVMVDGDDYYYLYEGSVVSGSGTTLNGDFIHLYDGEAIDQDGNIYRLSTGSKVDSVNAITMLSETIPLESFSYSGKDIETYESFSKVDDGTSETLIQPFKMLTKDGILYALDTSDSISGSFVVDTYNGKEYLGVVTSSGQLEDRTGNWEIPSSFKQTDIAHMTNNIDSEEPWVLVRYSDGMAAGFNYRTGETLEVENAISNISIVSYASNYMSNMSTMSMDYSAAYMSITELEEDLTLQPIEEVIEGDDASNETSEAGSTEASSEAEETSKAGEITALASGETAENETDETVVENPETASATESKETASETEPETTSVAPASDIVGGEVIDGNGEEGEIVTGEFVEGETVDGVVLLDGEILDGESVDGETVANQVITEIGPGFVTTEEATTVASVEGETTQIQDPDALENDMIETEETGSENGSSGETTIAEETMVEEETTIAEETTIVEATTVEDSNSGIIEGVASPVVEVGSDSTTTTAAETTEAVPEIGMDEKTVNSVKVGNTYVKVYNEEKKTYELYKTEDLLTKPSNQLKSEQEKLLLLEASGIVSNQNNVVEKAPRTETESRGLQIFWITLVLALGLTGFIVYRKKRY